VKAGSQILSISGPSASDDKLEVRASIAAVHVSKCNPQYVDANVWARIRSSRVLLPWVLSSNKVSCPGRGGGGIFICEPAHSRRKISRLDQIKTCSQDTSPHHITRARLPFAV